MRNQATGIVFERYPANREDGSLSTTITSNHKRLVSSGKVNTHPRTVCWTATVASCPRNRPDVNVDANTFLSILEIVLDGCLSNA